MKNMLRFVCCGVAVTCVAGVALAGDPLEEKLIGSFFLPEQVRSQAGILGLTDGQKTTLSEANDAAEGKVSRLKEQLQAEADKFTELAKQPRLDEKALVAQADKILDVDREVKHEQLRLLILIKNTLTAEQQATLNGIKSLDPKLTEAKKLAEKWKTDGRDLSKVEGMRSDFEAQLQAGKVKEAGATLDRALDILTGRDAK